MFQVCDDLKLPPTSSNNVLNDGKTFSTVQYWPQVYCNARAISKNGTVQKGEICIMPLFQTSGQVSMKMISAVSSNVMKRRVHFISLPQQRQCRAWNVWVALSLQCSVFLACTWRLRRSATRYQICRWEKPIPQLQLESAMTINYQKLMTQGRLCLLKAIMT